MGTGRLAALIEKLPGRFRPRVEDPPLKARVRITSGRLKRDILVDGGRCEAGPAGGRPDVEVAADEQTWLDIWEGRLSGIEAFTQRRLVMRGSIEKALRFEPLFDRPDAGGMRYRIERVPTRRAEVETLVAGPEGAPVLLMLHGLGATKSSWLTILPEMAKHFRVLAVDLPGFGASSKPIGSYSARWFADQAVAYLDARGVESALLAGNSMGGRICMEVAMRQPERVHGIACLCPATAFSHRPILPLVKLLRPELGVVVTRLPRSRVLATLTDLFAEPGRLDRVWFEAAVDDFMAAWRNPRARIAFFAAARQIYLEEPQGEAGFWERLARCTPPTLYVYGEQDALISSRFARRVTNALPSAEVHVWEDCGHVPQIEHPERTKRLMLDFYRRCLQDVPHKPRAEAG